MTREELDWIVPLLDKLRRNPRATLFYKGKAIDVGISSFKGDKQDYIVCVPQKYRLYTRHDSYYVSCITDTDAAALKRVESNPYIVWLSDWVPVPNIPITNKNEENYDDYC